MNLKLHMALWRAKRKLAPSQVFKDALKKRLLVKRDGLYGSPARCHGSLKGWQWKFAGVMAAVLLASSATGAYAYGSPNVTEGTVLYPLKLAMEKVEEKVYNTPEAKARFYLKRIKRREAEEQALVKRGREAKRARQEVERLERKLELLDESVTGKKILNEKVRERVKERLEKSKKIIELNVEKIPERKINANPNHGRGRP